MTVVNPKSISGINSITTGSGSDNLLTIHTSDASSTERFRIDSTGTTKIVTGIVTTLTATTGIVTTLTSNTTTLNSTTTATGNINISGANITLQDSGSSSDDRIILGAGSDLNIFHDGTDSHIRNNEGKLIITNDDSGGDDLHLRGKADEESIICNRDGSVELYNNNTKKAETNSSGFEVFGSLIAENSGAGSGTSEIQLQPYGTDGYINCTASGNLYTRMGSGYAVRTQIDGSGNFIVQSGNIKLATSGKGIDFSSTSDASGMTSELLDDYEEGNFTPILQNGNNGYRFQYGMYRKVGNAVHFTAFIETSATPPSSDIAIGGLPYTSANNSNANAYVFPMLTNRTAFGTSGGLNARFYMWPNTTYAQLYYPVNSSSSNFQTVNANLMNAANASNVWMSGTYFTE